MSLEVDHAFVWRVASRLKDEMRTHHPIFMQNVSSYSVENKGEVFADCMEKQFTVHRGFSDPVHETSSEISYLDMFPLLLLTSG